MNNERAILLLLKRELRRTVQEKVAEMTERGEFDAPENFRKHSDVLASDMLIWSSEVAEVIKASEGRLSFRDVSEFIVEFWP